MIMYPALTPTTQIQLHVFVNVSDLLYNSLHGHSALSVFFLHVEHENKTSQGLNLSRSCVYVLYINFSLQSCNLLYLFNPCHYPFAIGKDALVTLGLSVCLLVLLAVSVPP